MASIVPIFAALEAFLGETPSLTKEAQEYGKCQGNQERYLEACGGDAPEAARRLIATIKWRNAYRPELIKKEDIEEVLEIGNFYSSGRDIDGNKVVLLKHCVVNPCAPEQRAQYLVWLMEQVLTSPREKLTWCVDFSNKKRSPGGMRVMRLSMGILQEHYPERVSRAFIVNPPWFIRLSWPIVKHFVDKHTRDKLIFVSGTPEELAEQMSPFIPMDQLEECYGGEKRLV